MQETETMDILLISAICLIIVVLLLRFCPDKIWSSGRHSAACWRGSIVVYISEDSKDGKDCEDDKR